MSIEGKLSRRGRKIDEQNERSRKEEFDRYHFGLPETDPKEKREVPTRTRRSVEQSHGEATMERTFERRSVGNVALDQELPVVSATQSPLTDEPSSDEARRAQARATIEERQRKALGQKPRGAEKMARIRQQAEQSVAQGLPQSEPTQIDPVSPPSSPAEARPRRVSGEERMAEIRRKAKEGS